MALDLYDSIGKFVDRRKPPETAYGKVMSVQGNVAIVQINGSSQFSEVFFNKGTVISPGDECTLMRTRRSPRWVLASTYSANKGLLTNPTNQGNQGITGPSGADGIDAAVGNFYTVVDGTNHGLTHGVTTTITTLLITPTSSQSVLVGCNFAFRETSNTFHICTVGVEFNSSYRHCMSAVTVKDSGWPVDGVWPAAFTTVIDGLTVGVQNTVYIKAQAIDTVSFTLAAGYVLYDTWVLEV